MVGLKISFHESSCSRFTVHKTPFSIFQFHKTLITKNHKILFKMPKFGIFSFSAYKIGQEASFGPKISSAAELCRQHCCQKISSASPQIWHGFILQAPIFGSLDRTPPQKSWKVRAVEACWVPRGVNSWGRKILSKVWKSCNISLCTNYSNFKWFVI